MTSLSSAKSEIFVMSLMKFYTQTYTEHQHTHTYLLDSTAGKSRSTWAELVLLLTPLSAIQVK